MASRERAAGLPRPAPLLVTFAFTALAWSLGAALWLRGERAFAVSAFALGFSLGPCLAGYLGTPRRFKPLLRRVVLASGGLGLLAPGLLGRVDLDPRGSLVLAVGLAFVLRSTSRPSSVRMAPGTRDGDAVSHDGC